MDYEPLIAPNGRVLARWHIADLERKIAALTTQKEKADRYLNAPSLPGSYVTGRSGQTRAYARKMDRQLDKTIDNAKLSVEATRELPILQNRLALYRAGSINETGIQVIPPAQLRLYLARIDQALQEKVWAGKPLDAETRSNLIDVRGSYRRRLKAIQPGQWVEKEGPDALSR